jgi:hypothetical protein
MLRGMPPPIALSKSKLLSLLQCPRRLWLEVYSPELEEEAAPAAEGALAAGKAVGDVARAIYGRGGGELVSGARGLRAAIERTRELLAAGGNSPIFEATFQHDGLVVRVDVLDRSGSTPRIVEVKSSTYVKEQHLDDCAIQLWTLRGAGIPVESVAVAHIDGDFIYGGDGRYDGLLVETDVTAEAVERLPQVQELVVTARATLAEIDEPEVKVGTHCSPPDGCPFYSHCGPPPTEYPVLGLGGQKAPLFELLHAGYVDVRDVPEERLTTEQHQRIARLTREGRVQLDPELRAFVNELPFPRYFLDFETIAFAVPIWAATRPYEPLPFQWSCHIDTGAGALEHREFLDTSGTPPMRACAESLITALGDDGPILTYTAYERQVLSGLAARYPDLAPRIEALVARIVDLHPPTKQHYYHPQMRGSWSIKAVLPTVAPDLSYAALEEVHDGAGAQAAYLEAIAPETSQERRARLHTALLAYCRQDTLALQRLVQAFSRAA